MAVKKLITSIFGFSLVTLLGGGVDLSAQNTPKKVDDLTAEFISHHEERCETKSFFEVAVRISNPYPASCVVRVRAITDNSTGTEDETKAGIPIEIEQGKTIGGTTFPIPEVTEGIHRRIPYVLERVYISADKTGTSEYYNDRKDTLFLDVYKYPEPHFQFDRINGQGRLCSLDTVMVADYVAGDIYDWTVTSDIELLSAGADGNRYNVKAPKPANLNVSLLQTRGPGCSTEISEKVHIYTTPKGFIENVDENGRPETVRVCSIIEDPAMHFSSNASVEGDYPPFSLKLTNGSVVNNLPLGESVVDIYQKKAAKLEIAYVSDANGCHSKPADVSGHIDVLDRTPVCKFPQDTVQVTVSRNSRYFNIAIDNYTEDNTTKWSIPTEYDELLGKYGLMIVDNINEYTCKLTSSINALFALDYTEINTDGVACEVDKRLYIRPTVEFHLPSAISPNGDGVNDVLIIEGIIPENEFYVFDMKGKLVYEEMNYRNTWSADDVEDGHYVYVVKVGGETYKQMLAIKRTSNK